MVRPSAATGVEDDLTMLETLAPLGARAAAVLTARRETIAVADGATGGLILAGLLTVPGATRFCRGGGVVYSLQGRDVLLGLSREELAGMESVTESYAQLQAGAIRDRFGADWGIAESGAAGPDQHPRGAPIGRSCIAIAGPEIALALTFESGTTNRIANMEAFAERALRLLADTLEQSMGSGN
jgi:nicotinamide-nucleotide amidase